MTTDDPYDDPVSTWPLYSRIWEHPQFISSDVIGIIGSTAKAFEHLTDTKRDLIPLVGPSVNPGKGKRRLFTGYQVLMITAAYKMSNIGFPQRYVRTLCTTVEARAANRDAGLGELQPDYTMAVYPVDNGNDWAFHILHSNLEEKPDLPLAYNFLDVDRLIDAVKAQLMAITEGREPKAVDVRVSPEYSNPYGPKINTMKVWERSNLGNWKLAGLTDAESDELMLMMGIRLIGEDGDIVEYFDPERHKRGKRGRDRYIELDSKHQTARYKAVWNAKE